MRELTKEQLAVLERVALPASVDGVAPYTPFGYVIDADGTAYALAQQFFHGVILAALYPDLVERFLKEETDKSETRGVAHLKILDAPITYNEDGEPEQVGFYSLDDLNVFAYQRFELWAASHEPNLNVLRIAIGGFMHNVNVSRANARITPQQVEAFRQCMYEAQGFDDNSEVHCDLGDCSLKDLMTEFRVEAGLQQAQPDHTTVTGRAVAGLLFGDTPGEYKGPKVMKKKRRGGE